MDKFVIVCVLFFIVNNKCSEAGILYTNDEITWIEDPSNYTLVVDYQNTTISLCKVNDACQHISTFPVNDTSSEPLSLFIQKGVNIHIFTYTGNQTTQYYRVEENDFQSCRLPDISNDASIVLNTSSEYVTIPGESFILGENLIICDGATSKDNNTSCPIGCRLNITVRDGRCSIDNNDSDDDNNDDRKTLCSKKGDCTSRRDERDFTCKCWDDFTGVNCEITPLDISIEIQCSNKHCMNGGTCVPVLYPTNSSDKSRCECPLHVSGELCETILNSCASSPCLNGVCVEKEGGYECFCVPGFHGDKCELEYNECLSVPCLNQGTCIDRIDKYQCACSTGFTGINCERKINFCETVPCKHNATCTSLERTYRCHCPHGYTGDTCEHRVRECSSGPCKNHGTCIEFNHGYKCLCPVTFAGVHCEYMMDVFAPPMDGAGMSSDSHKHNLYIVAATLGSMILIVVSVIIACYCKIYETYKQVMWKRLRYNRKRSNSCPDMESCNDNNTVNKHRLSADAIWEATSLCHDNAAFEHHGNHQTFTNFQI